VPAVGGLATALLPVLERQGGIWISMKESDDAPAFEQYPSVAPSLTVRRVGLTDEERINYYEGMANSVLWPVSHYLIEHLALERAFMATYRDVNFRFAEAIVDSYTDGDMIWIHDYHLMLVPGRVRSSLPSAEIGFFWHIPWPAMEVLRILPWARELMRGMLGCDLIGFHVEEYVENFLEGARVLLGARVDGNVIRWEGREIRVEAHPIGIDYQHFSSLGTSAAVAEKAAQLRQDMGVEHVLVGIDRLDYTKGILSRLQAFEHFLEVYPEYQERVTLIQVATPSRTGVDSYKQLKRDVDETVGRINGLYARGNWFPVRYRFRTYSQEELAVLYRTADIALITPLRDGMNLVAHEFVAANQHGVLVLSEMTGAAYLLPEALQVNPYDGEGLARSIRDAIEMPREERLERLEQLKERVERLDVHRWARSFLSSMPSAQDAGLPHA
jgi:trehalose 6-phosphate synthase/phosphatase